MSITTLTQYPCPYCGNVRTSKPIGVTNPKLAGVFSCRPCGIIFHVWWQDAERTESSVEQVYKTRIDCIARGADPHQRLPVTIAPMEARR